MDEIELKSRAFLYLRKHYYHKLQLIALEGITKYQPNNTHLKIFNAISLLMCTKCADAAREFQSLIRNDDCELVATLGLYFANKKQPDEKQNEKYDSQLKEIRKKFNNNRGFYYAALFLFALDDYEQSKEYIDKCLSSNNDPNPDYIILKGWIELNLSKRTEKFDLNAVIHYFSSALNENKRYLDAAFGEIESYKLEKKYELAISAVNKMIVRHPNSIETLVAKMSIQFAQRNWEQTIETMNRIIHTDQMNLCAIQMNIVLLLCRDGNYDEAIVTIGSFFRVLEKSEPKNARIFYENARLFSRLVGRNRACLGQILKLTEKSVQLEPIHPDYLSELAYQYLQLGQIEKAQKYYKIAAKQSDGITGSVKPFIGMIQCDLIENNYKHTEQITQQMEFILEMPEHSPLVHYLQAKICTDINKSIDYYQKAIDLQMKPLKFLPYSIEYLQQLEPDFLLDTCKELLLLNVQTTPANIVVIKKQVLSLLKIVTTACPGLQYAFYLLAKVYYLTGDLTAALVTLTQLLKNIDDTDTAHSQINADAHLLMAEIYVKQSSYERASQSLEQALSDNFQVRENPLYHYIIGLVYKNQNNIEECIRSLTTALSFIDDSHQKRNVIINSNDKASMYMELITAYTLNGQSHEAGKILASAMAEFENSPEEARIAILNADQALLKRDIKTAVEILNKIKPEQPYYIEAHTKLADVYLKYRKDMSAFMQCFRELVENCPGPDTYLLFGDALMSIQEPERAIDAYERAFNCNPKDSSLASKLGIALVQTHQYHKAVTYYKDAIQLSQTPELKIDLAHLYMKLSQFDKADALLRDQLEQNKAQDDFLSLQFRTKCLLLLSKIQQKSGNVKAALNSLEEAKDCQNRLGKRIALEQPTGVDDQMRTAVEIYTRMAELSVSIRDYENATQYYKEALTLSPTNSDILVSLAKLYLQINHLELCQQTCSLLLKIDPENEIASVMMADLAFRKIDFDTASFHFKQILIKQPTYWTALARLIEVLRRTGSLFEVSSFLEKAEECCDKPKEPGLCYCQGLYEWYSGNPNAALRHFNHARQDPEWGQQAIYNMIEICLNPEDEVIGTDAFDNIEDIEYRDSRTMALRTAERLLKELKARGPGAMEMDNEALRYRLLANFVLLASKEKASIDKALEDFTALASEEPFKDHIGPILGVASAYILLKQSQRARNQLKRVAKTLWTFEDAEYLERCWLLLSDLYIQSTKFDLAMDLLRRVLEHNKTATKAYEFCGYIAEKEQHYKEAANYYHSAWKYAGNTNPAVGYKLAFCHMKCKKYADAIDVCNQVLKAHPDYPKIKKDILDKSLNNLRT